MSEEQFTKKCEYCGVEGKFTYGEKSKWQMQHFHFADEEIEFLTCDKCKDISVQLLANKACKDRNENLQ